MNSFEPTPSEPDPLLHRHSRQGANLAEDQPALAADTGLTPIQALRRRIFFRTLAILFPLALVLLVAAFFAGRHWVRQSLNDSLPQLDGSLVIPGLSAPVTVLRDAQGVPHIRAASLDDLLIAQGYV